MSSVTLKITAGKLTPWYSNLGSLNSKPGLTGSRDNMARALTSMIVAGCLTPAKAAVRLDREHRRCLIKAGVDVRGVMSVPVRANRSALDRPKCVPSDATFVETDKDINEWVWKRSLIFRNGNRRDRFSVGANEDVLVVGYEIVLTAPNDDKERTGLTALRKLVVEALTFLANPKKNIVSPGFVSTFVPVPNKMFITNTTMKSVCEADAHLTPFVRFFNPSDSVYGVLVACLDTRANWDTVHGIAEKLRDHIASRSGSKTRSKNKTKSEKAMVHAAMKHTLHVNKRNDRFDKHFGETLSKAGR